MGFDLGQVSVYDSILSCKRILPKLPDHFSIKLPGRVRGGVACFLYNGMAARMYDTARRVMF